MLGDFGPLLARSTVGLSIAAHGAQKAFGGFEGPGPSGAAGFMEGFRPGNRYATLSSYTELTSGLLITLGFGGRSDRPCYSRKWSSQTSVHAKNGYFAAANGVELGVMYAGAAISLATSGYGRFSLDHALNLRALGDSRLAWAALFGGAAAGSVALAQRDAGEAA